MTVVLYASPASHPCATAERALQIKGVDYRRVDEIPVVHRLLQRARFGIWTVPAATFDDGTRIGGSRPIVHALDERIPEPPLLPADRDARMGVERAEEWGDQVLQPIARRLSLTILSRAPRAVASYLEGARLPLPLPLVRPVAPVVPRLSRRVNRIRDPDVRADLIALPAHLDRIDRWIEEGTVGGEAMNAADLQIGACLRLLLTFGDLAPAIDERPAGALARRVFPRYPGGTPAGVLPAAWLSTAVPA